MWARATRQGVQQRAPPPTATTTTTAASCSAVERAACAGVDRAMLERHRRHQSWMLGLRLSEGLEAAFGPADQANPHRHRAHISLSRVRSRASPAALASAYARHTSAPGVVAAGRGRRRCGVPRTWRRRRAEADNGGALVLAMRAAQRAESRAEEEDGWRRELARKPNMGLAARP